MSDRGSDDDTVRPGMAATMAAFPELAEEDGSHDEQPSRPRWETGAVLGRGGMGTVFVAQDHQFGREVALKMMHDDRAGSRRRFALEALVTGNLEHPGIPAVYERGERDGKPYYVMRKIEGRTLTRAVRLANRFEDRLALLPAVVRVAHTLGFAHARGVVHRDVKPDNVVLGEHGETVLLDWGIARVREATFTDPVDARKAAPKDGTVAGAVVGTPAYMAPEQAAGRTEEVDERTDVFALGAMLYFVLAGTAPYQGPSGVAVLSAAIESNRVPIERAAPATAEGLRDILAIAMAKDPADRYPHAGAFADALQGFLDSKVRHASSPVLQAAGTAVGLLALVAGAVTGIIMSSSLSSFAEQGVSAWIYVVLTVVGGMLAILEWRTRGRNHFAPLILVFAAVTVLSGFASTMAGVGNILRGTIDMAPERGLLLFQRGFYELSGHVPVAVFAATLQLLAWALVRRQALITRDTENLAS